MLQTALQALNRAIMAVSMVGLVASAAILTLSVVLRYFLKVPTDWQDEMSVFLLVGLTFMTGATVQARRGHVSIEALAELLPPAANRVRRRLADIASCLFCSFFAWKSWTLLHEAVVEGETTSSTWAPPLWIPYSTMAIGMTLLALQLLLQASLSDRAR
jgi:TRAP-type C4-dicarboxylate transport system permease small subunit